MSLGAAMTQGSWNAQYKVNNIIRHGEPVSLNHNHTHFLLVDDGHRNRYGGVADFRAKLEKKLSSPANPTDGGGKMRKQVFTTTFAASFVK